MNWLRAFLDRRGRRQRLTELVIDEAMEGRTISVIEPPGGLAQERRALVEEAVRLLAQGDDEAAFECFEEAGVTPEAFRVRNGKLVPA